MIRKLTRSDEEEALLNIGERESFEENLPSIEFEDKFFQAKINLFFSHECLSLVFWKDQKPIGYLVSRINKERKSAYILSIFISKEFRGKGYGRELLEEIKKEENIQRLTLDVFAINKSAMSLYKKLGFKTIKYTMEYENDS